LRRVFGLKLAIDQDLGMIGVSISRLGAFHARQSLPSHARTLPQLISIKSC
jgi:hypothetical protein